MQYCIWIVSPTGYFHSDSFIETSENLQHGFKELGYDVPIVRNSSDIPRTHRPVIIGANLLKGNDTVPDVFIPIVYNLEQLSLARKSNWETPEYFNLLGRVKVWDYSLSNVNVLSAWGINAKHVEIGYSSCMTRISSQPYEYDILFYGCINDRRKKVLDHLKRSGLKVKCLFNVYGAERDNYIARSKIILNMHFYESKVFEITRCFYLMSNRKCIVSERGLDKELEGKYEEGIEFCSYNLLVNKCVELLRNVDEVNRIGDKGFEIFSKVTQAEYLKKVLE